MNLRQVTPTLECTANTKVYRPTRCQECSNAQLKCSDTNSSHKCTPTLVISVLLRFNIPLRPDWGDGLDVSRVLHLVHTFGRYIGAVAPYSLDHIWTTLTTLQDRPVQACAQVAHMHCFHCSELKTGSRLAHRLSATRESESTAQIRSRNDLGALLVVLHHPSALYMSIWHACRPKPPPSPCKCSCTRR